MISSSITSYTVTESSWARGFNQLVGSWGRDDPPYYPNPCVCKCVCLFACVFVRLFVCLLCFYVVILNVFVFLIYSMLKWQNEIIIHFVEGHPSSSNLMAFCQVLHGDYWPPCSWFHSFSVALRKEKHSSFQLKVIFQSKKQHSMLFTFNDKINKMLHPA